MARSIFPARFAMLTGLSILFATISTPSKGAETSLTLLRHQASEQLRLAAIAEPGESHDEAVTALCDLYVVLRCDPRYQSSDMLKGAAMKVRRRLLMVSQKIENQLQRNDVPRPAEISEAVNKAIARSLERESDATVKLTSMSQSQDTPLGGAAAAGGLANSGWELVELIHRIVAPDFWEPQGGPGSARYFAMRRVLVVRATSDVHQQIKDLLMALR